MSNLFPLSLRRMLWMRGRIWALICCNWDSSWQLRKLSNALKTTTTFSNLCDGNFWRIFFRVSDPDPDPYWIQIQSGHWIRIRIQEGKTEGFFCNLGVLYGDNCSFLSKKNFFFSAVNFFQLLLIKTLDPDWFSLKCWIRIRIKWIRIRKPWFFSHFRIRWPLPECFDGSEINLVDLVLYQHGEHIGTAAPRALHPFAVLLTGLL